MLCLSLLGCKDDSTWLVETTDAPMTVARVADPKNWDATIMSGALDQTIKIEGTNLNNVQTIFFNDVEAIKSEDAMAINGALYIRIPYIVPNLIDNKIKLTDKQGRLVEVPFEVTIPDLVVTKMDCEYAPVGSTLVISGNYLDLYGFIPETGKVKFGDVEAEIIAGNKTSISIIVPANAPANSIVTLISDQMTVPCPGKYKDADCMIQDFENSSSNSTYKIGIITGPGDGDATDPQGISGKFMRYHTTYAGGWAWQAFDWPVITNKPADLATNASAYAIKFECYAVEKLADPILMIAPMSGGQSGYRWGSDTEFAQGKWLTYSIPITETVGDISSWVSSAQAQFVFHAAGTQKMSYWCIDNVRISKVK